MSSLAKQHSNVRECIYIRLSHAHAYEMSDVGCLHSIRLCVSQDGDSLPLMLYTSFIMNVVSPICLKHQ